MKRIGYDKRVIISYDFSDIYSFKYLNYLIKIRFYILQSINTKPYVIDTQQSSFELCNEIKLHDTEKT